MRTLGKVALGAGMLVLAGCSAGPWMDTRCPDGQTVSVLRDPSIAYETCASQYENGVNATRRTLSAVSRRASADDQTRSVIRRFEGMIGRERSILQQKFRAAAEALRKDPCDPSARALFNQLIAQADVGARKLRHIANATAVPDDSLRVLLQNYVVDPD